MELLWWQTIPSGWKQIKRLCEVFIKENISLGGSADLLGVTVLLFLVEQYMSQIKEEKLFLN